MGGCSPGALTVSAAEWLPDRAVRASVRRSNPVSLRTSLSAGLVRIGIDERPDDPPRAVSDLLELPRITAVREVDEDLRATLLDLWVRVNDSGGSVGFPPGASRSDVEPVFGEHLAETRDGRAVLGVLREPDGTVAGFAWWRRRPEPLYAHIATLWRLQVDPERRGRNLGRLLLGGMHALARPHHARRRASAARLPQRRRPRRLLHTGRLGRDRPPAVRAPARARRLPGRRRDDAPGRR